MRSIAVFHESNDECSSSINIIESPSIWRGPTDLSPERLRLYFKSSIYAGQPTVSFSVTSVLSELVNDEALANYKYGGGC